MIRASTLLGSTLTSSGTILGFGSRTSFLSHVVRRPQTFLVHKPLIRARSVSDGFGSEVKRTFLKGLILAQNERWRRGLGMQVERIPAAVAIQWWGEVAKGAVRRG